MPVSPQRYLQDVRPSRARTLVRHGLRAGRGSFILPPPEGPRSVTADDFSMRASVRATRTEPHDIRMTESRCRPRDQNVNSDDSHAMWLCGVRMPERATGDDAVADELFDLFEFRKAALFLSRPDDLVINAHLKDATGPIRGKRHAAKLL